MTDKKANRLIEENSPYLLQHAYNPVDWYPWGEEAFEKAKKEDKLVLVSVGYSACHWCHVMEHETFEDTEAAAYMNEHFVCIKVDREERPDIDQIYMNAVQLMTQQGGWPLNCFTLNDGRPIYGGTYFPKDQWMNVLRSLVDLQHNEPQKMEEYATRLTEGVRLSELLPKVEVPEEFPMENVDKVVAEWKANWDQEFGGPNRAPKFPLPNNYSFLLHYAKLRSDQKTLDFVELTLEKMAHGGIYDQIGGGFARYSVDPYWKVPHFEKMLYDNGQLISLYAEAYRQYRKGWMKEVVEQSIEFCDRELLSSESCYYSALDADSEGEEGAYYVWTKKELKEILGDDYSLLADYYSLRSFAHWEEGKLILLREQTDAEFFSEHNIALEEGKEKIEVFKAKLLSIREQRERPGLDNKIITSWNAMMIKGLSDAYKSFGDPEYLEKAEKTLSAIQRKMQRNDGGLYRINPEKGEKINAYLDDYAFFIDALISLYQCTFKEQYLTEARQLTDYCMDHFSDDESAMFFYTSDTDKALIARKQEIMDNVIPASNSVMARNLFYLSEYFDRSNYKQRAKQMLANVVPNMDYGQSFSNWCILHLHFSSPYFEVAITGEDSPKIRKEIATEYLPNSLLMGTTKTSSLPLLKGKLMDTTTCFVCVNQSCKLPVHSTKEALQQIEEYH